jgi:thioredoxin reductase
VTWETIIVGGGPAGLTCAIFLGRYLRHVLVVDEGHPRNYASHGIHGFLGQHAIHPFDLLTRGREEAKNVGVTFEQSRVTSIERSGDGFSVTTATGKHHTRRVVLAYGVRDTLPDIPDIETYYGKSVHHCPDCDGYECRGKRIGVIGWSRGTVGLALKLLQWSDDVTIFTHGRPYEWDEQEQSKLLAERIARKDERIVALDPGAVLETGESVAVDAFFFNIKVTRSCELAERLGCEVDPDKPNVIVNEHRETTVEGVYAVGDLVAGAQLAITSAADGAIAAIAINKSLLPPSRVV